MSRAINAPDAELTIRSAQMSDAPSLAADKGADIADVYAFVRPGGTTHLVLAMTVHPGATSATTFDPKEPSRSIPILLQAYEALDRLATSSEWSLTRHPWVDVKRRELMDAFSQGADVHTRTARAIFGVEESQVTREMRGDRKADALVSAASAENRCIDA